MMRVWASLAVALALFAAERVHTQGQARAPRPAWPPKLIEPAPGEVEILPVRGHVSVIIGAGGNVFAGMW